MFKRAKKANLRRRNESDEDEKEDIQQPQPLQQTVLQPCGPFAEDTPARDFNVPNTDTLAGFRTMDVHHGNGFQPNAIKAVKKEKKNRDVQGPPKASLLSFDDDEGRLAN